MIEIGARKEAASRTARLDAVFAALADPTRRAIIERLSRGEARAQNSRRLAPACSVPNDVLCGQNRHALDVAIYRPR
jgi:DNA-binding transcriptional ArsR family regulator